MTNEIREDLARYLADIEDGEDWPTNEALGGNLTGTRDDEYRSAFLEQADELLASPVIDRVRADQAIKTASIFTRTATDEQRALARSEVERLIGASVSH